MLLLKRAVAADAAAGAAVVGTVGADAAAIGAARHLRSRKGPTFPRNLPLRRNLPTGRGPTTTTILDAARGIAERATANGGIAEAGATGAKTNRRKRPAENNDAKERDKSELVPLFFVCGLHDFGTSPSPFLR